MAVRDRHFARSLRQTPTDAERLLWAHLRSRRLLGCKFRRQHPIGPYVVDFCCLEQRLVVEVDGGQHADQAKRDARRTRHLEDRGYRVLRFWNTDVLTNLEGVLQRIAEHLHPKSLSPPQSVPSPLWGEGEGEGASVALPPWGERARVRGVLNSGEEALNRGEGHRKGRGPPNRGGARSGREGIGG